MQSGRDIPFNTSSVHRDHVRGKVPLHTFTFLGVSHRVLANKIPQVSVESLLYSTVCWMIEPASVSHGLHCIEWQRKLRPEIIWIFGQTYYSFQKNDYIAVKFLPSLRRETPAAVRWWYNCCRISNGRCCIPVERVLPTWQINIA